MKKAIKHLSILLALLIITNLSFAQGATDNALSYVTPPTTEKEKPTTSNVQLVASEISQYLTEKLAFDSPKLDYYNSDIKLMISMTIDEAGILENVDIKDERNAYLGISKEIKDQLKLLAQVTPVVENGKAVKKVINMPIVYKAVR